MSQVQQKLLGSSGFTLVELLVVIAVIGMLAGLLLTNFVGVRGRASDAKRKSDIAQLKTAVRIYYNDFQNYPTASSGTMMGCGTAGTSACSANGTFSAGSSGTIYMKRLPESFRYYSDAADEFVIAVELDNVSDSDIAASQTRCNISGRAYISPAIDTTTDYVVCED